MKKTLFNHGWKVRKGVAGPFDVLIGFGGTDTDVTLPHDAMIFEPRDPACPSKAQHGFYPAGSYTYTKTIFAPEEWASRKTVLEFEGIQRRAIVYLNGEYVTSHNNGYTGFYADLTPHLHYGKENTLKVLAVNEERASRWYPGSGIYRDVWLWEGGTIRFLPDKQRITTESLEDGYAAVRLEGIVESGAVRNQKLRIEGRVLSPEGCEVATLRYWLPIKAGEQARWHTRITLEKPSLWSVDTPNLYTLELTLFDGEQLLDQQEENFGVRTLQLDNRQGLRMNGIPVKLRGACIHHDNGIIGAATYYDAELFRLKRMKEAGFNALRSAHHPVSKAMLRACDRLGMLVMDEFSDMWQEPKNTADWSADFNAGWKQTLEYITDKDYNHPCVVLYSTGNEIPEIAQVTGAALGREVAEELRRLDPSRYTTFGLNGFLSVRNHVDEMVAKMEARRAQEAVGSEGLNAVMGAVEPDPIGQLISSEVLDACVEMAVSAVDVVGYNYMTERHESELLRYPHHVVVGSETFPKEIGTLWKIVEKNPHVIGDFTWTGYDYLGEAGIGIPHYEATGGSQGVYPDRLAYCGDIDLNGTRRPVSYLREIAYGLRKAPFLAVERVDKYGLPFDDNNWKYVDSIDSWTFPGWEGKPAVVRVLASCQEVELFLNGQSLGREKVGTQLECTAFYHLTYVPGELKAVGYQDGKIIGETVLQTAGAPAALRVEADRKHLPADGQSLAFITAELVDERGISNRYAAADVQIQVEGAAQLLGYGSACPSCQGSYQDTTWKTWDGKVMAVIRSTCEPGEIRVTFRTPGLENAQVCLESKA